MKRRVEIIGATAKFFRGGTAFTLPAPGTATKAAKPGVTDPVWLPLGMMDVTTKPTVKSKEIMDIGATGHRVRKEEITYGQTIDFVMKCKETQNLNIELLFGSDPLDDSADEDEASVPGGAFNVQENIDGVRGWLCLDWLGRSGQLLNTIVWVKLMSNGDFAPGEEPAENEVIGKVLYNSLNTGDLA